MLMYMSNIYVYIYAVQNKPAVCVADAALMNDGGWRRAH